MKPLRKIYKARWFARRHKLHWRAPIVCGAVNKILHPASVIDVGCATGDIVVEFIKMGVPAWGLEGCREVEKYLVCNLDRIVWQDLREPFRLPVKPYGLATCFEVAEHIEPEYTKTFIDNLTSLSSRILMSAAPPGQDGLYHVNCRDFEYWDGWFRLMKYRRVHEMEERIRSKWTLWRHRPGIKAFYKNLLYYELEQ